MAKKDFLLLSFNSDSDENILMKAVNQSKTVETRCAMTRKGLLLRGFRRYMIEHSMPGMGIWLGHWKKNLGRYQMVVVTASRYSVGILKWIHRHYPNIRLINYYWDKVEISGYPVEYTGIFENWSFDRGDCDKYGFRYNPQYYAAHLKLRPAKIRYDISFIGADREGTWPERTKLVKRYYRKLKKAGLHVFFYYVSNDMTGKAEFAHSQRLSEREYLKVVSESKAVLDIVQPGNEWMTLRPLLALSNGKKVVTNYVGIREYGFYCRENIFILGKDDERLLCDFIKKPFYMGKEQELMEYEIDAWARRFQIR